MKKLTLAIFLFVLSATAQERSPASAEVRRELSTFGPFFAFSSLVEGIASDERIIFLKTPIGALRLPSTSPVYTYFGPLRAPGTNFPVDPFSIP